MAAFDLSCSILRLGKLIGKPFAEKLGVREGGVEPPYMFSIYISDIRHRLESLHPRLCKMLHLTVAILLYADDAALPADSLEDLALSVHIFEDFCNEMHLYISVNKTFLMIFHAASDPGIIYSGDRVCVDGVEAVIQIYGERVKATSSFKYLGVTLQAGGGPGAHITQRLEAFKKAAGMLMAGLAKIPAFPHNLLLFLWKTLVQPVIFVRL